jgi:hypothetical protein
MIVVYTQAHKCPKKEGRKEGRESGKDTKPND